MPLIQFYFEIHQPRRLYSGHVLNVKDVKDLDDLEKKLFDDNKNKEVLNKVANKCYIPMNSLLLDLLDEHKEFKFSFSITGVLLEQLERYNQDALELFKQMAQHKNVEVLAETYFHSLASFWGIGAERPEFEEQVFIQLDALRDFFGIKDVVTFRNTELLYNNSIAKTVEKLGFKAMLLEGIEWVMQGRSPNFLYKAYDSNLIIFPRNYALSDDVAYRFSARWFSEWPLTADKYATWLAATPGEVINLFMDYETFGEHQWADTGIFEFMRHLPWEVEKYENLKFGTFRESLQLFKPLDVIYVDDLYTVSWADLERDPSAWLGNDMQRYAFEDLKRVGELLNLLKGTPYYDKAMRIWRYLQTSDHLYYMSTKNWADGDVHKYFSPYDTPHDAFEALIKATTSLKLLIKKIGEYNGLLGARRFFNNI